MKVVCRCSVPCSPAGTLYPDLPDIWICGVCHKFNKELIKRHVRYCPLCFGRYSYPYQLDYCTDCKPIPFHNSWSWYTKQSTQPTKQRLQTLQHNRERREQWLTLL